MSEPKMPPSGMSIEQWLRLAGISPPSVVTDEMVERAARAMCAIDVDAAGNEPEMHERVIERRWERWAPMARVALEAALQPAQAEA